MHASRGRTSNEDSGGRTEVLTKSPRTPRIIHSPGSVEKSDASYEKLLRPTFYCLIAVVG